MSATLPRLSTLLSGFNGSIASMYPSLLSGRQTGKSNLSMQVWLQDWSKLYGLPGLDEVTREEDGNYKVNASRVMEKIEWLTESFGLGSNNPKSPWRTRWIHMEKYRKFEESTGIIWMQPDVAMLYKLKWSGE